MNAAPTLPIVDARADAVIALAGTPVTARCHPRAFATRGPARFELDTSAVHVFDPRTERRID